MSLSPSPPAPLTEEKWDVKVCSCWVFLGFFFWNRFLVIEFHVQDGLSLPRVRRWELQVCCDKQAACRQLETSGLAESSH